MKVFWLVVGVLVSQTSFATELSCHGYDLELEATYHGRQKEFTNLKITYEDQVSNYPLAKYDPSYKPRNPNNQFVAYRVMANSKVRTGITLLLPANKDDSFKGILVGRDHEYHGEPTYEHITCELQ